MDENERDDINCAMEIAKEALAEACERITELAGMLDAYGAGERGMASERMHAYIIPSLESWLSDRGQIGSLASIEEELKEADDKPDIKQPEELLAGYTAPYGS